MFAAQLVIVARDRAYATRTTPSWVGGARAGAIQLWRKTTLVYLGLRARARMRPQRERRAPAGCRRAAGGGGLGARGAAARRLFRSRSQPLRLDAGGRARGPDPRAAGALRDGA